MTFGVAATLITAMAALIGSILGQGGVQSLITAKSAGRAAKMNKGAGAGASSPAPTGKAASQAADHTSLAVVGLFVGGLALAFAVVTVLAGLRGALSVDGPSLLSLRVIASLLSSFAMVMSFRGVTDPNEGLTGTRTAGIVGLSAGLGALTAMVVLG